MLTVAVQHRFRGFTLDAAFDAPPGLTVLFGRSGSGKTSVVNAVAGLLTPDAGRITVDGQTLFDSAGGVALAPNRRRLGYIFQEARLFPHMNVRQNLLYGRWFAPRDAPRDTMDQIVGLLGLGALLERRPAGLSGGERQRVAIGRALLAGPRLVLADEPLAALDDARKEDILPYFERLRDEIAVPILYVTHSVAEVARLATTVVVLENGRVVREGSPEDVLSDPQVTPMGAGTAGAVLDAVLVAQHPDGITEVRAGGVPLFLPRVPGAAGARLRVRIEAQDVMLATQKPQGISALNVQPAQIREIRMGAGPGALVQLSMGSGAILARVTRRSVAALGLAPEQSVYAVIKAVSVPRSAIGLRGPDV